MSSFCVVEKNNYENHAGSKARNDVAAILEKHSYIPLSVHHSEEKGTADKLFMAAATILDWWKVEKRTNVGDLLLIQYPLAMYPKVSQLAIPFVSRMKKKGVRIVLLIHDLESLRGLEFKSEKLFLELAEEVIVHNEKMREYLRSQGYRFRKIYILGFFDYLIPEVPGHLERNKREICFAGNLKPNKCGFIRELPEISGNVVFHLYGPNYEGARDNGKVIYRGEYTPEELPCVMTEGWGLIWDGDSTAECRGLYGEYLKFNNPHKASLYLASGMPLIVWKKSAIAPWVIKKKIGLAAGSIQEAVALIDKVTDEEYRGILQNVQYAGKELRKGNSLRTVLSEIERYETKA